MNAYSATQPGPEIKWSLPDGFEPRPPFPRLQKYYVELRVRNETGRDRGIPPIVVAYVTTNFAGPVLEMMVVAQPKSVTPGGMATFRFDTDAYTSALVTAAAAMKVQPTLHLRINRMMHTAKLPPLESLSATRPTRLTLERSNAVPDVYRFDPVKTGASWEELGLASKPAVMREQDDQVCLYSFYRGSPMVDIQNAAPAPAEYKDLMARIGILPETPLQRVVETPSAIKP